MPGSKCHTMLECRVELVGSSQQTSWLYQIGHRLTNAHVDSWDSDPGLFWYIALTCDCGSWSIVELAERKPICIATQNSCFIEDLAAYSETLPAMSCKLGSYTQHWRLPMYLIIICIRNVQRWWKVVLNCETCDFQGLLDNSIAKYHLYWSCTDTHYFLPCHPLSSYEAVK